MPCRRISASPLTLTFESWQAEEMCSAPDRWTSYSAAFAVAPTVVNVLRKKKKIERLIKSGNSFSAGFVISSVKGVLVVLVIVCSTSLQFTL